MLIGDLFKGSEIESLELTMKFAGARQRVIASNIANLSTPNSIQLDLSPQDFQAALRSAVDRKRSGATDGLQLKSSRQIAQDSRGEVTFTPTTPSGNILMHDRNDRDVERLMQANAENAGVFRVAVDLLRSRYEIMRTAISQRV